MLTNLRTKSISTLADINQRNREFWTKQAALLTERMSDEVMCSTAFNDLGSEAVRGVQIYFRKTLEKALEDAARTKELFQKSACLVKSTEQRKIAKAPRGKVTADGRTIDQIIESLSLNPEHQELSVKKLWNCFYTELKQLELSPREISVPGKFPKLVLEYRFKERRKPISFKRFAIVVSKARQVKSR